MLNSSLIKYLLLLLPLSLLALITYTVLTRTESQNIDHLFFLSSSTFIIYGFQTSRNHKFQLKDKLIWWLVLFIAPSIAGLVYWFKHINRANEE